MGSADPPGKMDEKLTSENMQKKSSFLCLCRPVESQIGARGMTLTGPPAGYLTHE